jgi:hypothetical protein
MSRTPGNPLAPVNSAVYIVGVYNDPAILDLACSRVWSSRPRVGYLPVDNVDRFAGHYIIVQSSRQSIHHPPAPEHFVL